MTQTEAELGPVDYLVVEYPDGKPTGEALPYLLALVDNGTIRILDVALIATGEDGSVTVVQPDASGDSGFAVFDGAATGMLSDEDLADAAAILTPGAVGAILVYENTWAAPFATALRRAGARMVANGRIPVNELLAAIDAEEENA